MSETRVAAPVSGQQSGADEALRRVLDIIRTDLTDDPYEAARAIVLRAEVAEAARDEAQQTLGKVWALYVRRCAQTVGQVSDGEEMFLADLRAVLCGDNYEEDV